MKKKILLIANEMTIMSMFTLKPDTPSRSQYLLVLTQEPIVGRRRILWTHQNAINKQFYEARRRGAGSWPNSLIASDHTFVLEGETRRKS